MNSCKINKKANQLSTIIIQVIFIFMFLTIFFFAYIVKVEKDIFGRQVDIITDDLISQTNNKFPNIGDNNLKILNGIIDDQKKQIEENSKDSNDSISKNNDTVKFSAYSSVLIAILIGLIAVSGFIFSNYCISISHNIKESFLILFFVAFTEILFLILITTKYISASPNKVKTYFGKAILNWTNKNS